MTENDHREPRGPAQAPRAGRDLEPLVELSSMDLQWLPGEQDEESVRALVTLVQVELQALAKRLRSGFSPPPSLETVELVGEMYVRLLGGQVPEIYNRQHFFSIAAKTMRWILVARHRRRRPEALAECDPASPADADVVDLEALDSALEELAHGKPQWARLIELNYFLGIAPREIAEVTECSERTVFRDLQRARSWLFWRLGTADSGPGVLP